MTREPEPPSYRSPASGGRPRSDVVAPAKRSHLDWEVRIPARENQAAGLRRRHSPTGVCAAEQTPKWGVGLCPIGGINQI